MKRQYVRITKLSNHKLQHHPIKLLNFPTMNIKHIRLIILGLLVISVFAQTGLMFVSFYKDFSHIYPVSTKHALWRSANFSQGRKFAQFVEFLNLHIPEETRVVLPPRDLTRQALGNTPLMQFFLTPREVINCVDTGCLESISLENTYLIIVKGFPG